MPNKSKLKIGSSSQIRWGRVLGIPILLWILIIGIGYLFIQLTNPFASKVKVITDRVDERPLVVEVISPVREVINPVTEVTVISNKELKLEQHNRAAIQFIDKLNSKCYYIVRVENLPVKKTDVNLTFTDEVGNESKHALEITRKPFSFPPGFDVVLPWDDAEYILDGDDLAADVDKQHRLLEDYAPDDLIDLNEELGIYTLNNAQLRSEAAFALKSMLDALVAETGKYITVASGYRSYQTQVKTYANWVRELGEKKANGVSAKPGHSEHQLGTTIDFVSDATKWKITNKFGDTVAGKWLADHCKEYGFIIPYYEDQSDDGGYKEESWHFRYVGLLQD